MLQMVQLCEDGLTLDRRRTRRAYGSWWTSRIMRPRRLLCIPTSVLLLSHPITILERLSSSYLIVLL